MSDIATGNLFRPAPAPAAGEVFETLLVTPGFQLERIVSTGQATPAGEWLCQDRAEWVVVLAGRATLQFDGEAAPRPLEPGDHMLIPPGRRHRVAWTDPAQTTIWLALHYPDGEARA